MGAAPAVAISVVVPILNEGATVPELVARLDVVLSSCRGPCEIVLVDDGSRPDQVALLRDVRADRSAVRLVELDANYGQAAALACGLSLAHGAVVVTMDADLQDLPEEVPHLVDALDRGAQVAKGQRRIAHEAWWRRIGSRAVTRLAGWLLDVRLSDYGGQFNAYDREAVDALLGRWQHRRQLVPLACSLSLRVEEVRVERARRAVGRSRYRLPQLMSIAADLVLDYATARTVAGVVGASATAVGLGGSLALPAIEGRSQGGRRWARAAMGLPMMAGGVAVVATLARRSLVRRAPGPAYVVRSVTGHIPPAAGVD